MAPEYLVRGQLTEKADVYGFGVLVLETATGRKNSVFSQGSSSILLSVRFIFLCSKNVLIEYYLHSIIETFISIVLFYLKTSCFRSYKVKGVLLIKEKKTTD
jgi:hypothetical protein